MEQQEQADILRERSRVLTGEILDDARKKAARIISKAEKEAASVRKDSEARSAAVRAEINREAERRADGEANKVTAGSGLECKRLRLAAMNAFLEELAEEGIARLQALTGKNADTVRLELLRSMLPVVGSGDAVLILNPAVTPDAMRALAAEMNPELTLEIRTDDTLFQGEFILEEEGGRLRHLAVFREIYEIRREVCLRAMFAALSGGSHD